jgi:hypothetical protein
MDTKIRKTQEEEVLELLKREGFRELSEDEIKMEPYKSIYKMPECFKLVQDKEPGLLFEEKPEYKR